MCTFARTPAVEPTEQLAADPTTKCCFLRARAVARAFSRKRPLQPEDNPVERIWAALLAQIGNTAGGFTERIHQARVFFRRRSLAQNLAATPRYRFVDFAGAWGWPEPLTY